MLLEYHLRNLRIACILLALPACRELGLVEGTPRERYERALDRAHLSATALGTQWFEAGREALANPVTISLSYRETGYFPAERALAAGFAFPLERGQRLTVHLGITAMEPGQVFLDLFNAVDSNRAPEHLVSADSGETGLDLEIEESGTYLVRIQPELLRSVRYTLTIRSGPTLAFPVDGAGNEAIRSRWGAERDGGRRQHEGIDIFAPRGTPVLAAAAGRVVNVGDNRLGGLVVWLQDPARNQMLYYAHLDRQIVREGETVEKGDTLGLVGNTGNARTTPPHLHFGIYRRGEGPIDPSPFVWRTPTRTPATTADSSALGAWVRVAVPRAVLAGNRLGVDTIVRATVMRVVGASGERYRVELPDRRTGFVPERALQLARTPAGQSVVESGGRVLDQPVPGAVLVSALARGTRVGVLGKFGQYDLVRTAEGAVGWMRR